uniref:Uncharacterized protein n=1 Tax=Magallana gigas TaxID=29159 RepID=A0A8W8JBC8_MAGGI
MDYCALKDCHNTAGTIGRFNKSVKLRHFPKKLSLRTAWIRAKSSRTTKVDIILMFVLTIFRTRNDITEALSADLALRRSAASVLIDQQYSSQSQVQETESNHQELPCTIWTQTETTKKDQATHVARPEIAVEDIQNSDESAISKILSACQGQFPFQEKNFPYNVLYWNDKEKTDSSVFDLTEQEINKDIEDGNLFFKDAATRLDHSYI